MGLKILSFIKEGKEVFIVYSEGKINKVATFWRIILISSQVAIVSAISFKFLITPIYYKVATNDQAVLDEMDHLLSECGRNSFMSWSVIDGKNLRIKTVRGCVNNSDNCIDGNVKEQNPIYKIEHKVDPNTFQFMQETTEGSVAVAGNIEEWRKYDTLYKILSNTNLPITDIGITLVRDFKNNVIYAFSLSFVKDAEKGCKDPWLLFQQFGLRMKSYL